MRRGQGFFLIFWFGVGVALATLAANRVFSSGLVDHRILYESLEQGWRQLLEKRAAGILRVLFLRLLQTVAVAWLCRKRSRPFLLLFPLCWAGFGAGLSLVVMTWNRGPFGLLWFVLSWFPHQLFYGAAWGMMILDRLSGRGGRNGSFRAGMAALVMFGILTEIQLNPRLLSLFS